MLTREKFLDLLDQLESCGLITAPRPYSGRAMYGKQCVAVSGEETSEWHLAIQMASWASSYDIEMLDLPAPRTEQLGRSFIMYWPQYEWPEERTSPDNYDGDDD